MRIPGAPAACELLGSSLERAAGAVAQATDLHLAARRTAGCWSGTAERAWQELAERQGSSLDQLGGQLHRAAQALLEFSYELQGAQFLSGQARYTATLAGLELTAGGTIAPVNPVAAMTPEAARHNAEQVQARGESLRLASLAVQREDEAHLRLRQSLQGLLSRCQAPVPTAVAIANRDLSAIWEGGQYAGVNSGSVVSLLAAGEKTTRHVTLSAAAARLSGWGLESARLLRFAPGPASIAGAGLATVIDVHNGESWRDAVTKETASMLVGQAVYLGVAAGGAALFAASPVLVPVGAVAVGAGAGAFTSWAIDRYREASRQPKGWTPVPGVPRPSPPALTPIPTPPASRPTLTPTTSSPPLPAPSTTGAAPAPRPQSSPVPPPRPPNGPVRALRGQPIYASEA